MKTIKYKYDPQTLLLHQMRKYKYVLYNIFDMLHGLCMPNMHVQLVFLHGDITYVWGHVGE